MKNKKHRLVSKAGGTKTLMSCNVSQASDFELPYQRFEILDNVKSDTGKSTAVIEIEGAIGFDLMKWFKDEPQNTFTELNKKLKEIEAIKAEKIVVKIINSPGGIVSDGIAMHDALVMHPAEIETQVIGYAASISTILMQAGSVRKISANAKVLSHHAWANFSANVFEAKQAIEQLTLEDNRIKSIYKNRGVNMDALKGPMDANNGNGKWILASDAKEIGLVDEVFTPSPVFKTAASADKKELEVFSRVFNSLPEMEDVYSSTHGQQMADDVTASKTQNLEQEEEMDEKTRKEFKAEVVADVMAAMDARDEAKAKASADAAAKAKAEEDAKNQAPEIAFEGDMDNPEDVKAHAEKIKSAKLKAAVNWNDFDSVMAYYKSLEGNNSTGAKGPQSNQEIKVKSPSAASASISKDVEDTKKAMLNV